MVKRGGKYGNTGQSPSRARIGGRQVVDEILDQDDKSITVKTSR